MTPTCAKHLKNDVHNTFSIYLVNRVVDGHIYRYAQLKTALDTPVVATQFWRPDVRYCQGRQKIPNTVHYTQQALTEKIKHISSGVMCT